MDYYYILVLILILIILFFVIKKISVIYWFKKIKSLLSEWNYLLKDINFVTFLKRIEEESGNNFKKTKYLVNNPYLLNNFYEIWLSKFKYNNPNSSLKELIQILVFIKSMSKKMKSYEWYVNILGNSWSYDELNKFKNDFFNMLLEWFWVIENNISIIEWKLNISIENFNIKK